MLYSQIGMEQPWNSIKDYNLHHDYDLHRNLLPPDQVMNMQITYKTDRWMCIPHPSESDANDW